MRNEVRSYMIPSKEEQGRLNRLAGENFEFRVLRSFKVRSDVLFAIRSAGSHSAVDIVIQYKNGKQLWITCKANGYIEPKERNEISNVCASKPDNVEVRLYYYKSAKKMAYARLA